MSELLVILPNPILKLQLYPFKVLRIGSVPRALNLSIVSILGLNLNLPRGLGVHHNTFSRIGNTSHLQQAFCTYVRSSCKRFFIGLIRCLFILSPLDLFMIRFALSIMVFIYLGSFQLLNKKLAT